MKDLTTMIDEINEATNRTISVTCYGSTWDLSSYRGDSLFSETKRIMGKSFREVVEAAHALIPTKKTERR